MIELRIEGENNLFLCFTCVCVCVCVYIYTYCFKQQRKTILNLFEVGETGFVNSSISFSVSDNGLYEIRYLTFISFTHVLTYQTTVRA
jgi:hypothetical protein